MKVFDAVFFQHKTVSSIGLAKKFIWSVCWDSGQPNKLKLCGLLSPPSLIILPRSSGWPTAPTSALAGFTLHLMLERRFLAQTSRTSLCQLQTFLLRLPHLSQASENWRVRALPGLDFGLRQCGGCSDLLSRTLKLSPRHQWGYSALSFVWSLEDHFSPPSTTLPLRSQRG